jgi:hypothetical protein
MPATVPSNTPNRKVLILEPSFLLHNHDVEAGSQCHAMVYYVEPKQNH